MTMLSSALKSKKAIGVNIKIMRAFVLIRQHALSHLYLTDRLNKLELKFDQRFHDVYKALSFLMDKFKAEIDQKDRKK